MTGFVQWCARRVACLAVGHEFRPARVFHPDSPGVVDGYRCSRCYKDQVHLWRWQTVTNSDDDGDGEEVKPEP